MGCEDRLIIMASSTVSSAASEVAQAVTSADEEAARKNKAATSSSSQTSAQTQINNTATVVESDKSADKSEGSTDIAVTTTASTLAGINNDTSSSELFNVLSAMHLTGAGANSSSSSGGVYHTGAVYASACTGVTNTVTAAGGGQLAQPTSSSRKRKILDYPGSLGSGSGSSGTKLNSMRPPGSGRRTSDVDDDLPLHTPQCSQSGESGLFSSFPCV